MFAAFQQIVIASRQLSKLLLPQKIKDILGVFSETRVFVQQSQFCVFSCRYFYLSAIMLAELAVWKQSRKAHNVQVFLPTVNRILVDVEELVVIDVTLWGYFLVQLPNCVCLETGYILGVTFSIISPVALSQTLMTFLADLSTESSSKSLYSQLISFNL